MGGFGGPSVSFSLFPPSVGLFFGGSASAGSPFFSPFAFPARSPSRQGGDPESLARTQRQRAIERESLSASAFPRRRSACLVLRKSRVLGLRLFRRKASTHALGAASFAWLSDPHLRRRHHLTSFRGCAELSRSGWECAFCSFNFIYFLAASTTRLDSSSSSSCSKVSSYEWGSRLRLSRSASCSACRLCCSSRRRRMAAPFGARM